MYTCSALRTLSWSGYLPDDDLQVRSSKGVPGCPKTYLLSSKATTTHFTAICFGRSPSPIRILSLSSYNRALIEIFGPLISHSPESSTYCRPVYWIMVQLFRFLISIVLKETTVTTARKTFKKLCNHRYDSSSREIRILSKRRT